MFVNNIDPTLFHIGPFEIRYYGIVYVLGFLLAYYVLVKRRNELKMPREEVDNFMLWLMVCSIAGARAFHILFWEPAYYLSNPLKIFALWEGGMAIHGGILGAVAAIFYFAKKHKISFYRIADILVVPAAFALALGRIANFINNEIVGTISNLPWCVQFKGYDDCRHPVQLYAAIGRFALGAYLIALQKMFRLKEGLLFWNFVLLLGIGRFFCDFFREDPRMFGLSAGQYFSIVMIIAGAVGLWYISRHYCKRK